MTTSSASSTNKESRKLALLRELALLRVASPEILGVWLEPQLPDPPQPHQRKSGLHAARAYLTELRRKGLVTKPTDENGRAIADCWIITPKAQRHLQGLGHNKVPPPYRLDKALAQHELGVSRFVAHMQRTGLDFAWEDNNRRYGQAHRVPDVLFRLGGDVYGVMEYDRGTVTNTEMGHRLTEYLHYVQQDMLVLTVTAGPERCHRLRETLQRAFEAGSVADRYRERYLFAWEGAYDQGLLAPIWYDLRHADPQPLPPSKSSSKV